jgi:hypothetical protein
MAVNEKEIIKEVAEKGRAILKQHKINLQPEQAAKVIETVMTVGLEQLILATKKVAAENGGEATVSFKNLLDVCITNRESEDGEKDGNQMIAFVPGPQAKMLAKQDDATEGEED